MISSVGTGKSMMLLLKIWQFCQKYPNSLALIVRKEFTDLRDSTLKDFQTYFGVSVGSDKDFKFSNGSVIMFRHGGEMAVLKNMNLSIAGIEQAEEFESDEVFTFLRDRLRRQNAPLRQLCVIANANGHNWLWRLWIQRAETVNVIDEDTGQYIRERGEFLCCEANINANKHNLPKDFYDDMMAQKEDAPNHFNRYVMNSHEDVDADDLVYNSRTIYDAPELVFPDENRIIKRVSGFDIARYGQDFSVYTIIEQKDLYRWEQVFKERFQGKGTTWLIGYGTEMQNKWNIDLTVVDDVGVGGGVTDGFISNRGRVLPFIANANASANVARQYEDSKTEAHFMTKDLLERSWLKLLNDHIQAEQLMSIRFKYTKGGSLKQVVGKEEMRKKYKELKSPDDAEALVMAVWGTNKRPQAMIEQSGNLPRYATVDSDIDIGIGRNQGQREGQPLPLFGVAD